MRRVESAFAPMMMFVFAAFGCETSADTSTLGATTAAVTSIFVDPSFFMGELPCSAVPGGMQSYVAHIYDVTNQQPIALPASPPTSCAAAVTFQQVVVGRKYRVKIDGYDLPPSMLVPVGGMSSGSRTMTLEINDGVGPVVTPRWTTHCDDVISEKDTQVNTTTCTPFPKVPVTTGISVDPRVGMKSAIPALTCKKEITDPMGNPIEVGDVFALHIRPDNPSLPALLDLPCIDDGPAPPAFTQGLTVGQTYTFRVEAVATAAGPVVWGTSCFATAKEGLVVNAACDPLRSDGAMEIVIDGLLGADTCSDANVVTFDAAYAGPPKETVIGVACGKSVRFSPLTPGKHAVAVVGHRKSGDVALEATCSATVAPGTVSVATCTLL
jgi:hypothetical protein